MTVRNSDTDPLQIAEIPLPGVAGVVGVTFCPGKKDAHGHFGAWDRDLAVDLAAIRDWGASTLVTLIETHEFALLKVTGLPQAVEATGLRWLHLPIRDVDVPDAAFEAAWAVAGADLHARLAAGERIVVHCRGGLGRAGTVAARLLVEAGMAADDAIALVRKHRKGAIETRAQEAYVRTTKVAAPVVRPQVTPGPADDRAVGGLLGLAVGDAVGTTLEFKPRDGYAPLTDMVGGGPFRLKPGEWTDDTSMALCLADSLIARGGVDPLDLMTRFRRWRDEGYNSVNGKCFDIGIATREAVDRFLRTKNPLAGSTARTSAGNGSIMRLAPVAIFHRADPAAAEAAAVEQSRTTHAAAECLESCRLMARVLVALLDGAPWQDALLLDPASFAEPKVQAIARGDWRGKTRAQIRSSGYVIDTLEAALWAVDSTASFRDAVLLAANLGDDADTVAAVTGQFAGARYGASGIPADWLAKLAWREKIAALARSLAGRAR